MATAGKSKKQTTGASNASFEAHLWADDDALRNNMDAAEYKHRVRVRRVLRKYGYPPDKQEKATQTVLQQAELLLSAETN